MAEVVEPRYDELFTLIQSELRRSGYEELIPAGVVLTGGTSKMEGAVDLAEEIFHMPVRLGAPQYARGLHDIIRNPIYATAVGLLLYGAEEVRSGIRERQELASQMLLSVSLHHLQQVRAPIRSPILIQMVMVVPILIPKILWSTHYQHL